MLAYTIGMIGIWTGFAALALNVTGLRAAPTALEARRRRLLAICASVLGLAVCPVTFLIGFEASTIEGPVLLYGWPFYVATTDRFAGPIGPEWFVGDIAFWLFAPQVVVYLYERFRRARLRPKGQGPLPVV